MGVRLVAGVTALALAANVAAAERAIPLEVSVNSAQAGSWLLLERDGELFAPREAFDEWRLELDRNARSVEFRGVTYWPLSSLPGFASRIDVANQSVDLLFAPQAFAAVRVVPEPARRLAPSPVLPSVFLNYDVNYNGARLRDAPSVDDLGVLFELGASSAWGVLTSTQVGRNLAGESALGRPRSLLRLETALTRDFPDRRHTLRVGDATTRAGIWGRNLYFGGLQYGTNFALAPDFITQPLPSFVGSSTAPSTVELYVNDVLRQVSNVPTGPFTIDNVPIMTGSGDARLVVRDLLGRETVIVQPFFASNRLLARGLSDWTVDGGNVREDYGVASNRYGTGFGTGTWRYGYGDALTLEARAELSRQLRTVGVGLSAALPGQVLGSVALATSDHQGLGRGGLWVLTLEREQPHQSVALQVKAASPKFHVLGLDAASLPSRLQVAGNWTTSSERLGTLGFGFASIRGHDGVDISTVSGNCSIPVGRLGSLTFTASRAIAGASGTAFGVNFIVPLAGARIASANATLRDKRADAYLTASQNPSTDASLGWRVLAGQVQDRPRAEGALYHRGRYGSLTAEGSTSKDQSSVRLGANGGLVLADGSLFVTRRIEQGFAVAEVKGYGDVGIGIGSHMLTRTDAKGVALIPDLWPFTPNAIRINANELPINAQVGSIEQVAVPARRSGVKVSFPVRGGRGALLRIVFDDGDAAPPGAIVQIEGDTMEHYVARRGESFVTGLEPGSRVVLRWKTGQCALDVVLPPEKPEEFPRIGPLPCRGVPR